MNLRALLLFIIGCFSLSVAQADELPAFTNSEIEWKGSTLGLGWKLTGKAREAAQQDNSGRIDQLIETLNDKNRFAAAHIVLAGIYGIRSEMLPNRIDDNPDDDTEFIAGLRVTFGKDGTPTYDERDRKLLTEYWRRQLKTSKPDKAK